MTGEARKVLYVSGSRADYGPARRVLKAIDRAADLDLSLLVTGMHLDSVHGETWSEIEADGFRIAGRIEARASGDTLAAMAASVGRCLCGMSEAMGRLRPDIVVVLGDRGEMLAGAMAAAFLNIPVVHLCGGTLSGSIDDSIRHAVTKFAHCHLVACEEFARRVIQMGEEPETVRVVGLPGGDIRPDVAFSREEIAAEYSLPPDRPYLLVIQHAVTHSREAAAEQITETLEAVSDLGLPVLLANPNDDAGGRVILVKMREYAERYPNLRILEPPRDRERFASIMAHAGVLVGNSSCGTVEAMSVGLPVVNIGDRQRGREATSCMLNAGYDRGEIGKAIGEALHDAAYRQRLASFRSELIAHNTPGEVVKCLQTLDLSCAARPKTFCDLRGMGFEELGKGRWPSKEKRMNIRGKRILIRAIEREDLPLIQTWFNDPEIAMGLGDLTYPTSRLAQERWYERTQSDEHTVRLAVENEAGLCIGLTGFWQIHWRDRRAEHAVVIGDKSCHGKGYGRETIAACARHAFEEMGLFRLDAAILATNEASLRAYQSCGFQVEGRQREHALRGGRRVDRVMLGLLESDYRQWASETRFWGEPGAVS
ncbi:MAG TPA: UDP-N-acetylglucosamine 2-epimerase [Sumerlaeia bacterium]|nr:UDP-N-acetylglucosamine 2-epimerase [Sumerlaeia bacterium]